MNREVLEREFPPDKIKQRKGPGGKTLDYVETHEVISRLNEAFDYRWTFEIVDHRIEESEVIVLGRLEVEDDGAVITKMQFGSNLLKKGMSTGDALKAAASDAIKKCATLLGIGLHLYRDEEVVEHPKPATNGKAPFDWRDAYDKCAKKFGAATLLEYLKTELKIDPSNNQIPKDRETWKEIFLALTKKSSR